MIAELDCVALTADLPEYRLAAGDVGAVVHVYKNGAEFMVEFTTFEGQPSPWRKYLPIKFEPSLPTKFITPAP